MQTTIVDRCHVLSTDDREMLQRRLLFALSRFSAELLLVEAVVDDQNGPRGGVDKQLRLKARLRNGETLTVEKRGPSVIAAVSHAGSRLARLVTRALDRRQERPASFSSHSRER